MKIEKNRSFDPNLFLAAFLGRGKQNQTRQNRKSRENQKNRSFAPNGLLASVFGKGRQNQTRQTAKSEKIEKIGALLQMLHFWVGGSKIKPDKIGKSEKIEKSELCSKSTFSCIFG